MGAALERSREPERLRILYLAANPEATERLVLGRELRGIVERLRGASHGASIEILSCWAVRPGDLPQALLEIQPHILHFGGHVSERHGVVLEGAALEQEHVEPRAFVNLISTLRDNIRMVVLNACHSEPLARALVEHIDCAVGMRRSISDKAAVEFAAAFYQAIGFGRSVGVAFELGLCALELRGIAEDATPRLVTRGGMDASEILLLRGKPAGPRAARSPARGRAAPAPPARLRELLPGHWSVEMTDARGVARGRAIFSLSSLGTFKGQVSGAMAGIFVEGHWDVIADKALDLRGIVLREGRLSMYTATVALSSALRDSLYGQSTQGERMAWRRVDRHKERSEI